MRPEDDPGWGAYHSTILEFHIPGHPRVDLARPIDHRGVAIFQMAGLPGPFGLVTPENPRGRLTTAPDNDQHWSHFRRGALAAAVRVDGVNPTTAHRERGVALPWRHDRVVDLARAWDQSAIYWYDGTAMWLVGALTLGRPERLGGDA